MKVLHTVSKEKQQFITVAFHHSQIQDAEKQLERPILDTRKYARNWDIEDREVFDRVVYLGTTMLEGVKKHYKDYYYQVQMQMMCVCVEKGMIVFFCPEMIGTKMQDKALHIIEIERDEEVWQDIINCIRVGIEWLID